MSTDPIKDGLNWYAYVGANPVTFTDPTGLNLMEDVDYYSNVEAKYIKKANWVAIIFSAIVILTGALIIFSRHSPPAPPPNTIADFMYRSDKVRVAFGEEFMKCFYPTEKNFILFTEVGLSEAKKYYQQESIGTSIVILQASLSELKVIGELYDDMRYADRAEERLNDLIALHEFDLHCADLSNEEQQLKMSYLWDRMNYYKIWIPAEVESAKELLKTQDYSKINFVESLSLLDSKCSD